MSSPNKLYFGDCLDVMREDVRDESVDLIYLDPPFNSKRLYNAFIGGAQWVAFDDTWRWHEAIDDFNDVAASPQHAPTMEGLRKILGEGPNLAYLSYMANRLLECRRVLKPSGSIYLHCDPTMSHYLKLVMDNVFKRKNFRNEIAWCYTGPGSPKMRQFNRKHDILFWYSVGKTWAFNKDQIRIPHKDGGPHAGGFAGTSRRPDDPEYGEKGKIPETWWTDIAIAPRSSKEYLGYPTQKPLKLLDRIIRASSNCGDIVLDPFCGCGTTVHAAQMLSRRWIGIDVCVNACKIIEKRLRESLHIGWSDIQFIGMPKTRDDAKVLADLDKFRFERWAASLVDGMEANKRQRGDKGIDGHGRFPIRKGRFIDIVSQVKGGHGTK